MEEEELLEGSGYSMNELLDKVYKALSGTSNNAAAGPDRISYRKLKAANQICLWEEPMLQVAAN